MLRETMNFDVVVGVLVSGTEGTPGNRCCYIKQRVQEWVVHERYSNGLREKQYKEIMCHAETPLIGGSGRSLVGTGVRDIVIQRSG